MNGHAMSLLAVLAALGAGAPAQTGVDPNEFAHLEPVLQRALATAAPFVVTVETFGGSRPLLAKEGMVDGDAPPQPRKPKAKPVPAPKGEPQPEGEPQPVPPPGEEPQPQQPGPVPMPPAPGEKPPTPEPGDKDGKGGKEKKKPLVAPGFQQAQGRTSGVVLTADGWILVSRFALNLDPTTILVTVPGRGTFHAERAGEDTSRGIALVKIEATGLPVPEFVDPATVQIGQWAFALGRTFAVDEPTVHIGIVSAKRRLFGRALQIDAYTSPANYGGAVVDVHGRVLGIAVPLSPSGRNAGVEWYDSGIGFATTIADIGPLLARMRQGQILQRAWLGVLLQSSWLGPGAKVAAVPEKGVAAAAGIATGDVILEVDGVAVKNGPHLQMLLSSHLGGDVVTLQVRDNDTGELVSYGPLTLADVPWEQQKQGEEQLPASFELPKEEEGGR